MSDSRAPMLETRLADLPLLTTRRACLLADCSRTTLQRTGPAPIGQRGRTFVYRTADILAWMSSGLEAEQEIPAISAVPTHPLAATSARALARIQAIKNGDGQ